MCTVWRTLPDWNANKYITVKLNKFRHICGTLKRNWKNKTRKEAQIKLYKVMAVPTVLCGSETWIQNQENCSNCHRNCLFEISFKAVQDWIAFAVKVLDENYEGWNFNSGNYLFTTDTK